MPRSALVKNTSLLILGSVVLSTLLACGKKDADKIGDAQTCLDTSSRTTVSQCIEKVAGLESAQSYVIRCAATFIQEGFDDPTRLSNAYKNMTNTGTATAGTDATLAVLSVMSFTSGSGAAANQALSDTNFAYCAKSGSKGLILLSGISQMATSMLALAQIASACSATDINCALNYAKNNTAAQAAVGAAAAAAYTSNCSGGQTSNQQFCNQFQAAVTATPGGTSNTTALGQTLLGQYCSTASHCP